MLNSLILDIELKREARIDQACLGLANHALYAQLSLNPERFLHPQELAYFKSLEALKRKCDFLMGRFAAKQALQRLNPKINATLLDIAPGIFQQPLLAGPASEGLSVCITHSGDLAAAIAYPTAHPLGIDLEVIQDDHLPALKEQAERREFPAQLLREHDEIASYTRAWTIKEALSKILRCGLTTPFSVFSLASDGNLKQNIWSGGFEHFHQYRYISLASDKYAFALVHPGRTQAVFDMDKMIEFVG